MAGYDPLFNLIFLVAAIIISRFMMERALRRLSDTEKARLVDSFSVYRTWNFTIVLLLAMLYLMIMRYLPEWRSIWNLLFFSLFLTIVITVSVLSWQKLKRLNLPEGYIRSYLLSLLIQYLGIGVVFAPMVAELVS